MCAGGATTGVLRMVVSVHTAAAAAAAVHCRSSTAACRCSRLHVAPGDGMAHAEAASL